MSFVVFYAIECHVSQEKLLYHGRSSRADVFPTSEKTKRVRFCSNKTKTEFINKTE